MKKALIFFITAAIAVSIISCESAEQKAYDDTLELMEDVVPGFGDIMNNDETEPTTETPQVSTINLNLPFTMTETTFLSANYWNYIRITSDGVLQKQVGIREGQNTIYEWQDIDTDVRSVSDIKNNGDIKTVFYIKNDNSLWGYGSNARGVLGDGTGIDKQEPVKILDNVAWVSYCSWGARMYAIKTDKTLWKWGDGENFAPVLVAENIVSCIPIRATYTSNAPLYTFQTTEGHLFIDRGTSLDLIFDEPIYDTVFIFRWADGEYWYINADRTLIFQQKSGTSISPRYENIEIATDVAKVFDGGSGNIFYTALDGTLWGTGDNKNGELGDMTKAPRNEPVKIADDVVSAYQYAFLKSDGTFWTWDSNNPTPTKLYDDVAYVDGDYIYFKDGKMINRRATEEYENVKIPRVITFD